jgi:hypothetical protein
MCTYLLDAYFIAVGAHQTAIFHFFKKTFVSAVSFVTIQKGAEIPPAILHPVHAYTFFI